MRRLRERKYDVIIGDGRNVECKILTEKELAALPWRYFKLIVCMVSARMVVTSSSGKRIEYLGRWPRMGRVTLELLQCLLLESCTYVTPAELAQMTGNHNLQRNECVAARIMALRKALHDANETYIQTRKTPGHYAIRWTGKPFIWIAAVRSGVAGTQDS